MADLIGLINDISPSVKFAWIGVLAWGTVQFVWYRRARVLPGTVEDSSSRTSFPSVTRPPETESIETPAPQVLGTAVPVDLEILQDSGLSSESDVLAEFLEPGTRRTRSPRRRRATPSTESNAVPDFALDTPKPT